jgi:hypothetical protein
LIQQAKVRLADLDAILQQAPPDADA